MVASHEVTWRVSIEASGTIQDTKNGMGPEAYGAAVSELRRVMCEYFSMGDCTSKLGSSISPVAGAPAGKKALKVRAQGYGHGRSGGLRLIFVVDCEKKEASIVKADKREDL